MNISLNDVFFLIYLIGVRNLKERINPGISWFSVPGRVIICSCLFHLHVKKWKTSYFLTFNCEFQVLMEFFYSLLDFNVVIRFCTSQNVIHITIKNSCYSYFVLVTTTTSAGNCHELFDLIDLFHGEFCLLLKPLRAHLTSDRVAAGSKFHAALVTTSVIFLW